MKLTISMVGVIALCSAGLTARSTDMKDSHMGTRAKDALTVTGCVALGDRVGHYLLIDAAAAGGAMKEDDMHMGDMAPRSYAASRRQARAARGPQSRGYRQARADGRGRREA